MLGLDEAEARTVSGDAELEDILMPILDWAVETGLIPEGTDTYRDLLDAKIMGCLVAPPSVIYAKFEEKRQHEGPEAATSWFYENAAARTLYSYRQNRQKCAVVYTNR